MVILEMKSTINAAKAKRINISSQYPILGMEVSLHRYIHKEHLDLMELRSHQPTERVG